MSTENKCPVCGKITESHSASENDCKHCGFSNAFVRWFATEDGYQSWMRQVQTAASGWQKKKKLKTISTIGFWLGNNTIAFSNGTDNHVNIILGTGKIQKESNAIGFSSCERNYAVLYADGTVSVFGDDNSFGQKNTAEWRDVKSVLCAPNCTYGVIGSGEILYAGSPCSSKIMQWKNIKLLRAGNHSIVGLTAEGKVCIDDDFGSADIVKRVRSWKGIKDVMASRDCVIGLSENGTVMFAGKNNDPRKRLESWRNVIAIALDNVYAYGLSEDGSLLVSGACKPFLDRGRKDSSLWKGIIGLSCNQAGIGAISEDGELQFAGTIAGDYAKMKTSWDAEIKNTVSAL